VSSPSSTALRTWIARYLRLLRKGVTPRSCDAREVMVTVNEEREIQFILRLFAQCVYNSARECRTDLNKIDLANVTQHT
jgi:hypothetical protein